MFLFEQIEQAKNFGAYKDLPSMISNGLNTKFDIRPYQRDAFCNFITYFENESILKKPTQVLFHMATGSGKTLIMAGLMIYLYRQGYRNFLFFVHLDNIVKKTKDNFLTASSEKYLFTDRIVIDGQQIKIREVGNFQNSDDQAINICFTTIQGLHSDLWNVKEGCLSLRDFESSKTVIISDEAHHLNATTKKGGTFDENQRSWQYTAEMILHSNKDNIALEFTATCDLKNPFVLAKYTGKIIYDYPLAKFREDKYSKDVKTLLTHVDRMDRAMQAVLLSQYRMKVFQDNGLSIKPVILFKAKTIAESFAFMEEFIVNIEQLTGREIKRLLSQTYHAIMQKISEYLDKNNIELDAFAQEIKIEFAKEKCVSANDDKEVENRQLILNSLESKNNRFRAIFAVNKLDEGWDVLNLFDIVRLYETRDAKNNKPGVATMQEAQLIGRGARYCPFMLEASHDRYKRKFDNDVDNALRICEELHYHCQNDSRYISELTIALKETGILANNVTEVKYKLKDEFRHTQFYTMANVFSNERIEKSRSSIDAIPELIRDKDFVYIGYTGEGHETKVFDGSDVAASSKLNLFRFTIGEIAESNYFIPNTASRRFDIFRFNTLKSYFPNLESTREFITSTNYLGGIKITIQSKNSTLVNTEILNACINVFDAIAKEISKIEKTYEGSTTFTCKPFYQVFRDKACSYTDVQTTTDGRGVSQAMAHDIAIRIDLSQKNWYVFNDNYGTSEEKAFVAYFNRYANDLLKKYDMVYLVRNERTLAIYSFSDGERFEPDFILFLQKKNADGYDQYQIFIEPKGTHLLLTDAWKEKFLLELRQRAIATKIFVDDNDYKIWGFPFFNQELRMDDFSVKMKEL